jgi:hypothetical protein
VLSQIRLSCGTTFRVELIDGSDDVQSGTNEQMKRKDSGQVLPLVSVVLVLVALVCVGLTRLGVGVAERAQARTAADAAALAGARDGEDVAGEVASQNHGELVAYVAQGGEVEVTVRVGGSTARARAARRWNQPALWP